jgi:hypothetical protein
VGLGLYGHISADRSFFFKRHSGVRPSALIACTTHEPSLVDPACVMDPRKGCLGEVESIFSPAPLVEAFDCIGVNREQ